MNRKMKKLELNRETVRGLDALALSEAHGGTVLQSNCATCNGSCGLQCQTLATKNCSVCCP